MLDNFCKSRTQLVKWKCTKYLRVYNDCGRGVENAYQILAGGGIHGCFSADGGVDHRHQTGGYLDDGNAPHKSGRDEPGQVADNPTAEGDHRGVPAEAADQHLVCQTSPCVPGLVGLAGSDGQDVDLVP